MKKLLLGVSILLFGAAQVNATVLIIGNYTNRDIQIVLPGTERYFNSLNSLEIKAGKAARIDNWATIPGPIQFAFKNEIIKEDYPVWESFNYRTDRNYKILDSKSEKAKWRRDYHFFAFPIIGIISQANIEITPSSQVYTFAGRTSFRPRLKQTYPVPFGSSFRPLKRRTAKTAKGITGDSITW